MASIKDIAKTAIALGKGLGLNKPRTGADSPFNVNKFIGKLQERNSLFRPSRYLVEVSPPAWAEGEDVETAQDIAFFAEQVNLPGVSLIPADIRKQSIGPFDRRPSQAIMPDLTLSIMLDSNGRNLEFFQKWVSNVVNFNISGGEHAAVGNAGFGELYYRDNYITTITIKTYDVAAREIVTMTFYECWPTQLGDVQLGWNQTDQMAILPVNFSIRSWSTSRAAAPAGSEPRQMGGFEQLIRIGTAAKALKSSLKKPRNVGDIINVVSNAQTFLGSFGGKGGG
jgi:hypothetical protein